MLKPYLFIGLFLWSNFFFAQSSSYKQQYPDEDMVTLKLIKKIDIKENGGTFKISENVTKRNLCLNPEGIRYTDDRIRHNTFNTIEWVSASTQNIEKGKTKVYKVTKFEDKDILINGIFYSDEKVRSVVYPNVKENSVTELNYMMNVSDPHFIPAFIFSSRFPIHSAEVSVSFPNNVEISYSEFNLKNANVNFTKKVDKNKTVYSWKITTIYHHCIMCLR